MRAAASAAWAAALAAVASGLAGVPPVPNPMVWPVHEPANAFKMINSHGGPWSSGRIQLPEPTNKHILVVPRLKLLFCFIPKVACTQFNRLMNELNGMTQRLGENCGNHDPIFASSVRHSKLLKGWGWPDMQDTSWTKAVFLRDPLERLVSAHRSKCENHECGGCLNENFSQGVLEDLFVNDNMHYLPQSHFCGDPSTNVTLETTLPYYNFVGHLSDNHTAVAEQVVSMLHLALQRRGPREPVQRETSVKASMLGLTAEVHEFSKESLERVANKHFLGSKETLAEDGARARLARELPVASKPPLDGETIEEVARKYFPPNEMKTVDVHASRMPRSHATGTKFDRVKEYFTKETLEAALEYYARDYQVLPGVKVPSWVNEALECVKITTGEGAVDAGHLAVDVEVLDEAGERSAKVADGLFDPGSTVLNTCWAKVLTLRLRSAGPVPWSGSVQWSLDGRVTYGPMQCADCTVGNSTQAILVASSSETRSADDSSAHASCLGGRSCKLVKAPMPPPTPTEAPTPVPTLQDNADKLKQAAPVGYRQVGSNCNCGQHLQDFPWQKPTPEACSAACEEVAGCASFAIWTNAATSRGMCRLFDAACTDTNGWDVWTSCKSPTSEFGPNVGFNRVAGPKPRLPPQATREAAPASAPAVPRQGIDIMNDFPRYPSQVHCTTAIADTRNGDSGCDIAGLAERWERTTSIAACGFHCGKYTALQLHENGLCACYRSCDLTRPAGSFDSHAKVYACSRSLR